MIKIVDEKEYEIIREWFNGHSFPVVPYETMPKSSTFISYLDGVPTLATCLYVAKDAPMALVAFFVANPAQDYDKRTDSFMELNQYITHYCNENGVFALLTFAGTKPLIDRLQMFGFDSVEPGQFMIKYLNRE